MLYSMFATDIARAAWQLHRAISYIEFNRSYFWKDMHGIALLADLAYVQMFEQESWAY